MRQALRLTKETTPGTYNASAVSTDIAHIRIVGDDGFPERSVPNIYYVRDAAGSNRKVQADFGTKTCTGRFNSLLYNSQASLILSWGLNLISAGLSFNAPYTLTIDHLMQLEDGSTVVYDRYLGCYPGDISLRAGNSGDANKFALACTFLYLNYVSITSSDYATPTLDKFPADLPLKFQQLAGGITLDGSSFAGFKSFQFDNKNMTKANYDESVYPQAIGWYGRDISARIEARYKSNAQRLAFNAITQSPFKVILSDGTNQNTFDFKNENIRMSLSDATPMGDAFYQTIEFGALLDGTAGTDFVYSYGAVGS